jgi:predicted rRNA methylase YqxC with S4 and FtsJ domains
VREAVHDLGAAGSEVAESPIQGTKGNREFLLYSRFRAIA